MRGRGNGWTAGRGIGPAGVTGALVLGLVALTSLPLRADDREPSCQLSEDQLIETALTQLWPELERDARAKPQPRAMPADAYVRARGIIRFGSPRGFLEANPGCCRLAGLTDGLVSLANAGTLDRWFTNGAGPHRSSAMVMEVAFTSEGLDEADDRYRHRLHVPVPGCGGLSEPSGSMQGSARSTRLTPELQRAEDRALVRQVMIAKTMFHIPQGWIVPQATRPAFRPDLPVSTVLVARSLQLSFRREATEAHGRPAPAIGLPIEDFALQPADSYGWITKAWFAPAGEGLAKPNCRPWLQANDRTGLCSAEREVADDIRLHYSWRAERVSEAQWPALDEKMLTIARWLLLPPGRRSAHPLE